MGSFVNNWRIRNVRTLVAHTDQSARLILSETLKDVGFRSPLVVPGIKDLLAMLEVEGEQLEWVILPVGHDSKYNALQVLKIIQNEKSLSHLQTTLLVASGEHYVLEKAFALGAMSWLNFPASRESTLKEWQSMHTTFEAHNWHLPLLSAHYLRAQLRTSDKPQDRLKLEKTLCQLYPDDARQYAYLGDSYMALGQKKDGLHGLAIARLLDRKLKPFVDEIISRYIAHPDDIDPKDFSTAKALGIRRCMIVEPDETQAKMIWSVIVAMGVPKVRLCADGQEAWDTVEAGFLPDMVICAKQLAQIDGLALAQRLRVGPCTSTPIILSANHIEPDETQLLKELQIYFVLRKPLERQEIAQALVTAMREERFPSMLAMQLKKLQDYLQDASTEHADILAHRILSRSDVAPATKLLVQAFFALHSSDDELANELLLQALSQKGQPAPLLHNLGRCLMRLEDLDGAAQCFQKAHSISPLRLERLNLIVECALRKGDFDRAAFHLGTALSIDERAPICSIMQAKIAFHRDQPEEAKAHMQSLKDTSPVVGYMNNTTVREAKRGRLKTAVELYERAIACLPANKDEERAALYYNMGLSLARANKPRRALKALKQVTGEPSSKLVRKADSLIQRIEEAIERGIDLNMKAADSPRSSTDKNTRDHNGIHRDKGGEDDGEAWLEERNQNQGERAQPPSLEEFQQSLNAMKLETACLQKLLPASLSDCSRVRALLSESPPFKPRQAIQRGMSMGLEKSWKQQKKRAKA